MEKGMAGLADLVIGSPEKEDANDLIRLQEKMARAQSLTHSFREGEGNVVVQAVYDELEARVNQLVAADDQCKSLLNIIAKLGREINVGEKAARKLLRFAKVEVTNADEQE